MEIRLQRLSDVFLPREAMVSRRADKLRFEFDSTKSGRRLRHVTLHAVKVSDEGHILLECLCAESEVMKSFRLANIVSNIECGEKQYAPEEFLTDYLGIPKETWLAARQTAMAHANIRNNFEKYVGEALADAAPLWTGSAALSFKFRGKRRLLTLKSVFLLGEDDLYLWGFEETTGAFCFVPLLAVESKITADGRHYQKKGFPQKFLGLS